MSLLGDLATLSKRAGFTKLLGVRLVSQVGDGMFQAGLASLFFFSPQSMAEPGGVASALVVLLLPYSLIGPQKELVISGIMPRIAAAAVSIIGRKRSTAESMTACHGDSPALICF